MISAMLTRIAAMIRRVVLDKQEEHIFRVGKAMQFTSQYLQFLYPQGAQRMPVLGFAPDEYFGIGDMTLRINGKSLGWIENIRIEIPHGRAVVGHFAVAEHLTGIGLAYRLALAFGKFAKAQYGVTHILFDERKGEFKSEVQRRYDASVAAS